MPLKESECKKVEIVEPAWLADLRCNPKLINVSESADASLLEGDHHFIHSINEEGRFEQFEVFHDEESSSTMAVLRLGSKLCGHKGIIHGGCIASVVDELFGWTLYCLKLGPGFTANLNVNYRKPLPANSTVLITTEVDKVEGRKVFMRSRVEDGEGLLFSEATALFIVPRSTT